jgi:hypothetical protein
VTHTDNCPGCGQNQNDDDDRTDEQVAADIAATTLARLARIDEEHHQLSHQLADLADRADDLDPDGDDESLRWAGMFLPDVAASLRLNYLLFKTAAECVRDIAAKLPVRGIDYGAG